MSGVKQTAQLSQPDDESSIKFTFTDSPKDSADAGGGAVEVVDTEDGDTGIFLTGINATKAMLGAGILVLPKTMQYLGVTLGIILTVLVCIVVAFGFWVTGYMANQEKLYGNLNTLGKKLYGKWMGVFVDVMFWIFCFGAMAAYCQICATYTRNVITDFGYDLEVWYGHKAWFVVAYILLAVYPLQLIQNLGILGFTSIIGICGNLYIIALVVYYFMNPYQMQFFPTSEQQAFADYGGVPQSQALKGALAPEADRGYIRSVPNSWSAMVQNTVQWFAIPKEASEDGWTMTILLVTLPFAFGASHIAGPLYGSLRQRSPARFAGVTGIAYGAGMVLNLLVGLLGYFTFGKYLHQPNYNSLRIDGEGPDVQQNIDKGNFVGQWDTSNILTLYNKQGDGVFIEVLIGRLLLCMALVFGSPFLMLALKKATVTLFGQAYARCSGHSTLEQEVEIDADAEQQRDPNAADQQEAGQNKEGEEETGCCKRDQLILDVVLGAVLLTCIAPISAFVDELETILGLTCAIAGSWVIVGIPGLLGWHAKNRLIKYSSGALVIYALVMTVIGVIAWVVGLTKK